MFTNKTSNNHKSENSSENKSNSFKKTNNKKPNYNSSIGTTVKKSFSVKPDYKKPLETKKIDSKPNSIAHVNTKKTNAEALFNKYYKDKLFTEYPFFITPLNEEEVNTLKEKISNAFIARQLPKGTSEVKNAICFTSIPEDKKLYICGYLDLNYEQMLLQLLSVKESKIPVVRLDLSLQHLVSETTKSINLKDYPRIKDRRPYVCRAFIV